ncbi:MAG: hypothetical protein J7621_06860 [Niastella sp.]|nr:hypothetical protein [Niastella sp.]
MRIRNIFLIVLCSLILPGGILDSARLFAQERDSAWWDAGYIYHSNAWLSSHSITGLSYMPVTKLSNATLSFHKVKGPFANFHESDNSERITAASNSVYRLNPHVVMEGQVQYEHFYGRNMNGSALINPYRNPVDIDEFADSNRGNKKLERYFLTATVSAQVHPRWTVGGRIAYEAANFAKLKDLRHVNSLTDLNTEAEVSRTIRKGTRIGASYGYHRRIESVKFETQGNTDRQYVSLINFGSFYGLAELFSDHGYTSEVRPLVNITHTASLHAGMRLSPSITWYNRIYYSARHGYYGEKGTTSIVFTEHTAPLYGYEGSLSWQKGTTLHSFTLKGSYETLANKENVYRSETSPAGNQVIVYYGKKDLLSQDITQLTLEYTAFLKVANNSSLWTIKGGAGYEDRQQTTIRYPFFRKQQLTGYRVYAAGERHIIKGNNRYSFSLSAGYGGGSGTPQHDGLYIPPASGQTPPASGDLYLYREYEYLTKPRVQFGPALQYAYKADSRVAPYLRLAYTYTKAFDVSYTGHYRHSVLVTAGCNF